MALKTATRLVAFFVPVSVQSFASSSCRHLTFPSQAFAVYVSLFPPKTPVDVFIDYYMGDWEIERNVIVSPNLCTQR